MKPIADRSAIRQAVERIKENLEGIEADRYLSTPQTIALYCWLIDCEPLNEIEPIERLHGILISGLENQIITRKDQEISEFCHSLAALPIRALWPHQGYRSSALRSFTNLARSGLR